MRDKSEFADPRDLRTGSRAVMTDDIPEATITKAVNNEPEQGSGSNSYTVLNERMHMLKGYASNNGLDKDYALIADMGISAGKKRFYLIDLNKMAIAKSGMLAYTKKGENVNTARVFRIERTGMEFYELYSLDKNGNVISPEPEILSPVNCVPNAEGEGGGCESDAGPGISPRALWRNSPTYKIKKKADAFVDV